MRGRSPPATPARMPALGDGDGVTLGGDLPAQWNTITGNGPAGIAIHGLLDEAT